MLVTATGVATVDRLQHHYSIVARGHQHGHHRDLQLERENRMEREREREMGGSWRDVCELPHGRRAATDLLGNSVICNLRSSRIESRMG